MMIQSKLILAEAVPNSRRRTSGAKEYFPVMVVHPQGHVLPALFSAHQLKVAMDRAKEQPEDAPTMLLTLRADEPLPKWKQTIVDWVKGL
jgi:hypothetical protein